MKLFLDRNSMGEHVGYEGAAIISPNNRLPFQCATRYWESGEHAALYERFTLFLDRVLNSDEIAFDVRYCEGRRRAFALPGTAPEQPNLADWMGSCREFLDLYEPSWSYTADWQLFFDSYREDDFGLAHPGFGPNMPFDERLLMADAYNNFIRTLRQQALERGVKKWLADWKAGLDYQDETIHDYIVALAALFDLLPVRLDFGFHANAVDDADLLERMSWAQRLFQGWTREPSLLVSTGQPGETRARIDPGLAMEYRNRFFKKRNGPERHVFEHMVGFIAKMERGGKQRANHFHCLFLFNARKGRDVEPLINALTRRWEVVTGYQGFVYNCHNSRWKQDMIAKGTWALDVIERGNGVKLARLDQYVRRYFAKDREQLVRIKPTCQSNTLTKGQFPSDL